jgi:hypothetical protein
MADIDSVRELLIDAAQKESDIDSLLQTGDFSFEIGTANGVAIAADYDQDTGRMMLSADVGTPAVSAREAVYDAMLNYAMLWKETGFVRLAVVGKAGPAMLMADVFPFTLNPGALATILVNFAEKATLWAGIVAGGAEAAEELHGNDFNMIRI